MKPTSRSSPRAELADPGILQAMHRGCVRYFRPIEKNASYIPNPPSHPSWIRPIQLIREVRPYAAQDHYCLANKRGWFFRRRPCSSLPIASVRTAVIGLPSPAAICSGFFFMLGAQSEPFLSLPVPFFYLLPGSKWRGKRNSMRMGSHQCLVEGQWRLRAAR